MSTSYPGLFPFDLTPWQAALVDSPVGEPHSLFLEGPAGCGKTTAGVARLLHLLEKGVWADSILVLVPQRTLGRIYYEAVRTVHAPAGAQVDVLTIGGLAQRSVELYWPLVAAAAGFAHPDRPPTFLTLETAQYYMDHLIQPFIDEGAFGQVTLSRQRLISQILDNLNKAAVVGFSYEEIGTRLSRAWSGESSRLRVYEKVQECASAFRRFCLAHNLLDFSLQVEVFARHVLALSQAAEDLRQRYRHLLVDNVEEDVPVTHDLLANWLPTCDSALLIADEQGGLRTYLGADPTSALALRERCRARQRIGDSLVNGPEMVALAAGIARGLGFGVQVATDPRPVLRLLHGSFHTQAVESVAAEVARLVHDEGTPPGQVAILAPFMGDALRFELVSALERLDVPTYSQRPSRALRDEPAARALLTLAKLAHPAWGLTPPRTDVAHALLATIAEMDLVRAWHLTSIVYRLADGVVTLASFEQIRPEEQLKVTYLLGNRYEELRKWLAAYVEGPALPLDHFWSRLFDEVLSRPGYIFRDDRDSATVTAHLVDSGAKFRRTIGDEEPAIFAAFVSLVEQGAIAAQYIPPHEPTPDAVFLAPAYTFVMGDRPVDVQFWLDLSSASWGRRLYQPLTHPYVLTRHWPADRVWTDADEDLANRETLYRLVLGLIRRCRRAIYLADSTYNERGREEQGMLQRVIFRLLRQAARPQPGPGEAEDEVKGDG